MCGLVAVSGAGSASDHCVAGLKRLQYRGYDSYGFAYAADNKVDALRSLASLDDLSERLPEAFAVLGHTRWATHGAVTLENCHPHSGPNGEFAVVHNGIVENCQALVSRLVAGGTRFRSDTDTEVIVHLLDEYLGAGADRPNAMLATFAELHGRNTIVVLFADGEIYGIRQGSPLVLGRGADHVFLSSDILSFSPLTRTCYPLKDATMVRLKATDVTVYDHDGRQLEIEWLNAEIDEEEASLDGYSHFMLKEVMEQWYTVARQAAVPTDELAHLTQAMREADTVLVTGAGGAYYAAYQIAWLLRHVAGLRALAVQAYEIETLACCVEEGDLLLAVSQSGETADTVEAVNTARHWGLRIACLVNMPLSTLTRLADFSFYNRSGPEVCVLSTKSASAQITFGFVLASSLADNREEAGKRLDQLSSVLSNYLVEDTLTRIAAVARQIACREHVFILGRDAHYGSALVGALNIKEASYLHAEAFAAGELKHGVIALIEQDVPVIVFVPREDACMINAAAQVKSRGALVIGLADRDNPLFDVFLPLPATTGDEAVIPAIIPCQLLAYYLAITRGIDPDRPRNLAKSVTVR